MEFNFVIASTVLFKIVSIQSIQSELNSSIAYGMLELTRFSYALLVLQLGVFILLPLVRIGIILESSLLLMRARTSLSMGLNVIVPLGLEILESQSKVRLSVGILRRWLREYFRFLEINSTHLLYIFLVSKIT